MLNIDQFLFSSLLSTYGLLQHNFLEVDYFNPNYPEGMQLVKVLQNLENKRYGFPGSIPDRDGQIL